MKLYAFHPAEGSDSDYSYVRNNGMWYVRGQGGYEDILDRGCPRPKHKTTVLAELYSPNTPDFLHGVGTSKVPFLVSQRAKLLIRKNGLTGIRFSRVEVVKVATKGKGKGKRIPRGGEPEDLILKAKDQSFTVSKPKLYAVYVIGRLEIVPKYPSGRCPITGFVTPYDLPKSGKMPDMWHPTINGLTFSGWPCCTKRFRDVVVENSLTNISFEPFETYMDKFLTKTEDEIECRKKYPEDENWDDDDWYDELVRLIEKGT